MILTEEETSLYQLPSWEEYVKSEGNNYQVEINYYKSFLESTDYIIIKMAEQKILNESLDTKYSSIIEKRQQVREEINKLQIKELSLS